MKTKILILTIAALILHTIVKINPATAQNDCRDHMAGSQIPYHPYWNPETYKPGWKLIFNDEFDGTQLDDTKWEVLEGIHGDVPDNSWDVSTCNTVLQNCGTPNYERQFYKQNNGNIAVSNGTVKIIAKHNPAGSNETVNDGTCGSICHKYYYTSGWFNSKDYFGYGFYEIRCKLPVGEAFWPAWWMFGAPPTNEIDIYENAGMGLPYHFSCTDYNGYPQGNKGEGSAGVWNNLHVSNPNFINCPDNGTNLFCAIGLDEHGPYNNEKFFTIGFDWGPDEMKWYINGYLGRVVKKAPCEAYPTNLLKMILNLAIEPWTKDMFLPQRSDGTLNPNTGNPANCEYYTKFNGSDNIFEIDYVRYYQKECDLQPIREYQSNTALNDFCTAYGYADNDKYTRLMADFNFDKKSDIIGFNDNYVSLATSEYDPGLKMAKFNYTQTIPSLFTNYFRNAGYTTQERTPRMTGDLNADGKADIIGFNANGTKAALSNCTGLTVNFTINPLLGSQSLPFFGNNQGFTSQDRTPRFIADVDLDGRADIIGINGHVFVSLSTTPFFAQVIPTFTPQAIVLANQFSGAAGFNSMNTEPRFIADVNADGKKDIIGMKANGTFVSLNTSIVGTPSFAAPVLVLPFFGTGTFPPFTDNSKNPRYLADVNADGKDDIVGIEGRYVWVSLSTSTVGVASFGPPTIVLSDLFGPGQPIAGWADNNKFPRLVTDINCDGKADIVGFWNESTMISLSRTNTSPNFSNYRFVADNFVPSIGWSDQLTYPRMLADIGGDCGPELIGFGYNKVYVYDCISSECKNTPTSACYIAPPAVRFTMVPEDNQFFPIEHYNSQWQGCPEETYTDGHGVYAYIKGYVRDPNSLYASIQCKVYNNVELNATYVLSGIDNTLSTNPNLKLCSNPMPPLSWVNTPSGEHYFEMKIPINSANYQCLNNSCSACNYCTGSHYTSNALKEWKFEIELLPFVGAPIPVKTIKDMVCGDLYVIAGQSNATASVPDVDAYAYEAALDASGTGRRFMRTFSGHKMYLDGMPENVWPRWQKSGAIWWSGGYSGILGLKLQQDLINDPDTKVPVGIIQESYPGSKISQHLRHADPLQGTLDAGYNNYSIYRHMIEKANDGGQRLSCRISESGLLSHVKALIWYQGEADCNDEADLCSYAENFRNFYNSVKDDLNDRLLGSQKKNTKIYMVQLNTIEYSQNFNWNNASRFREIQREIATRYHDAFIKDEPDNLYDVRIIASNGDDEASRISPPDDFHYSIPGYELLADKLFNVLKYDLYIPSQVDLDKYLSPNILRASYDDVNAPAKIILEFDLKVDVQQSYNHSTGTYYLQDYFFDEFGNKIDLLSVSASGNTVTLELDQGSFPNPVPPYTIPYRYITYLPSAEYDNGSPQGTDALYTGPWIINASGAPGVAALSFYKIPIVNDDDPVGDEHWSSKWGNKSDGYIGKWKLQPDDELITGNFYDDGNDYDEIFIHTYKPTDADEKMALLKYSPGKDIWESAWRNSQEPHDNITGYYYSSPPIYFYDEYYRINAGPPDAEDEILAVRFPNPCSYFTMGYDINYFKFIGGILTDDVSLVPQNDPSISALSEGNDILGFYQRDCSIKLTIADIDGLDGDEVIGTYDYPAGGFSSIKVFKFDGTIWKQVWSTFNCIAHEMYPYRNHLFGIDMNDDGIDEILGMDFSGWATTFSFGNIGSNTTNCTGILLNNNYNNFNWGWSTYGCQNPNGGYSFGLNGLNGTTCGGWTYPPDATDKMLIGSIDNDLTYGDVRDEIFFIQRGSNAQWATTMDYNTSIDQWDWNFSANPDLNVFTLSDWPLADDGTFTDYHLLRFGNPVEKSVLALRKNKCEGYAMAILKANSNINHYKTEASHNNDNGSGSIEVFPNPNNGSLYLKLIANSEKPSSFYIYDLFGKLVNSFTINEKISGLAYVKAVDMSEYPGGIYLVKWRSDSEELTSKFIIVK